MDAPKPTQQAGGADAKKKKHKHRNEHSGAPSNDDMMRMFPKLPPAVSDQEASTVQDIIRNVPDLPVTSCGVRGCVVHLLIEHVVFACKLLIVLLNVVGEFTAERIVAHGAHDPEPDSDDDDNAHIIDADDEAGGNDADDKTEAVPMEDTDSNAQTEPPLPQQQEAPPHPAEKIRVDLRGPSPDEVTDIYSRTIALVHATADAAVMRFLWFSHSTRNDSIANYLYGTCCKHVRGEREFVSAWKTAVETWVHDEQVATLDAESAPLTLPMCVNTILSMYTQDHIQIPLSTYFMSLQRSQRDEEPKNGVGNPWPICPDQAIYPNPEESHEYQFLSHTEKRALPNQTYGHYWEIPAQSGERC